MAELSHYIFLCCTESNFPCHFREKILFCSVPYNSDADTFLGAVLASGDDVQSKINCLPVFNFESVLGRAQFAVRNGLYGNLLALCTTATYFILASQLLRKMQMSIANYIDMS